MHKHNAKVQQCKEGVIFLDGNQCSTMRRSVIWYVFSLHHNGFINNPLLLLFYSDVPALV